VPMYTVV